MRNDECGGRGRGSGGHKHNQGGTAQTAETSFFLQTSYSPYLHELHHISNALVLCPLLLQQLRRHCPLALELFTQQVTHTHFVWLGDLAPCLEHRLWYGYAQRRKKKTKMNTIKTYNNTYQKEEVVLL